jgi:hypothetical protein
MEADNVQMRAKRARRRSITRGSIRTRPDRAKNQRPLAGP